MANFNDVIFSPNYPNLKQQGSVIVVASYRASGMVVRGSSVNYSGYANQESGKILPQWLFKTSGS